MSLSSLRPSQPTFRRLVTCLALWWPLLLWLPESPLDQAGLQHGTERPQSTEVRSAARAFKDAQSGSFRVPTTPELSSLAASVLPRSGRPAQRLVEQPGTTRAGGVALDLQGRFHSLSVATRGAGGELSVDCHDGAATGAADAAAGSSRDGG